MTALTAYHAECDERRALEDIEDAAWEAGDLFGKALDAMSADELDDMFCLEPAADDARSKAAVMHGVDIDELPSIDALISAADVPERIATALCAHCGRRAA